MQIEPNDLADNAGRKTNISGSLNMEAVLRAPMIATNGRYYKFNDENKDDQSESSVRASAVVNHQNHTVQSDRDFD